MKEEDDLSAADVMFGMSPEQDRKSCSIYLQMLGRKEFAETLSARLAPAEIEQLVDLTSALMRTHLSKQEYHRLFLGDNHHH